MPSWKKVVVSGSDASFNSLYVLGGTISAGGFTGSLFGTASQAVSSSYAVSASFATNAANGGVTQLLAGPNITLSPTTGKGQVTITATLSGSTIFNTATGSYGSFYDTTTQTNPVANIPRSMSFNTTDITNGVSISGSTSPFNTYIKTQNAGVYNIQFSAQLDKTDSGADEVVIWLAKNGTNLTDSATTITLNGNNDKQVAAWNWFVTSAANDYYQIIWRSADTNLQILAEPQDTHPGIPSIILTVNRIDQFLSNTGSFSGSFNGQFTGSLFGTASQAISASYATFATTASFATNFTASNILATGTITAQTLVVQTVSSSIVFSSGSNRFGNNLSNTQQLTGSVTITGSLQVNGRTPLYTDQTASLTVLSASYAQTASYVLNAVSSSFALTSSYSDNISGTTNYIPKFTGGNSLGNSIIFENATGIGINDTSPTHEFQVSGDAFIYNSNSTINSTKYGLLPALNVTTTGTETNQYANVSIYGSFGYSATTGTFTPLDKSFVGSFLGQISKSGGASVVGKMSSFAAGINLSGAGNVTTIAGFRAYAPLQSFALPAFSGTVTNYIGLLIDDINGTTDVGSQITNRFGILQSGSFDRNYFAGPTNFASTITGSISGSASFATSASYAQTASYGNATAVTPFSIGGSLVYYGRVNSSIAGQNNLFTIATGSNTAGKFIYTAYNGANARSGEILAVWNAGNVTFTDISTTDIGSTTPVTASISIVSAQVQLNFQTNTSGWTIKSTATLL